MFPIGCLFCPWCPLVCVSVLAFLYCVLGFRHFCSLLLCSLFFSISLLVCVCPVCKSRVGASLPWGPRVGIFTQYTSAEKDELQSVPAASCFLLRLKMSGCALARDVFHPGPCCRGRPLPVFSCPFFFFRRPLFLPVPLPACVTFLRHLS